MSDDSIPELIDIVPTDEAASQPEAEIAKPVTADDSDDFKLVVSKRKRRLTSKSEAAATTSMEALDDDDEDDDELIDEDDDLLNEDGVVAANLIPDLDQKGTNFFAENKKLKFPPLSGDKLTVSLCFWVKVFLCSGIYWYSY